MYCRPVVGMLIGAAAFVAVACSGSASSGSDEPKRGQTATPAAPVAPEPIVLPDPTPETDSLERLAVETRTPAPPEAPSPGPVSSGRPVVEPTPTPDNDAEGMAASAADAGTGDEAEARVDAGSRARATPTPDRHLSSRGAPRFVWMRGWKTDFSKNKIDLTEILQGGPPRNGIPPINEPKFLNVADSPDYMNDNEPVISLEINGDARAYPLSIAVWHEIINDEVGGVPVTVTYCPLCNTAIVFDRRVSGVPLEFGTSGMLRKSDLVMWDVETESWWQQATGEAIIGELMGAKLKFLPAQLVSWSDYARAFPDGKVLSRETGFVRDYTRSPYAGYDDLKNDDPALFLGDPDPRLDAMERVVGLTIGDESVAYPFMLLADQPVVNDLVDGRDVVVFYTGGTLSPFAQYTASVQEGFTLLPNRVVGSTGVYEPFIDGKKLTFKVENDIIVDEETGSKWNILGQGVDGPLKGRQLPPVIHGNHFWFAWASFYPQTAIRTAADLG